MSSFLCLGLCSDHLGNLEEQLQHPPPSSQRHLRDSASEAAVISPCTFIGEIGAFDTRFGVEESLAAAYMLQECSSERDFQGLAHRADHFHYGCA